MASQEKVDRIQGAYRAMTALGYRPAAPSDGFGGIIVPTPELDVDIESREYCQRFLQEEDTNKYWVGNPDFRANRAFIWTLEALRLMCAGNFGGEEIVPKLLRMAAEEYEAEMIEGS